MAPPRTLPEALAEAAQSGEGYVFAARDAETRRSYAEMFDAAQRAASVFRATGLRRGDLVALIVDEAEWFLTALFGASSAGVIPASLYPPSTSSDRRRYLEATAAILRNARARAVVTTAALASELEEMRSTCPDLDSVISAADLQAGTMPCAGAPLTESTRVVPAFSPGGVSIDDIAFVQFTSGSTSAPKGVAVTHRSLAANIEAINGPAGLASSSSSSGPKPYGV